MTDTASLTPSSPHASNGAADEACPGCGAPLAGDVLLRGHDRFVGGPGRFEVVACATCGLASTRPRPAPEHFADYYPETYTAYDAPSEQRRRRFLRPPPDFVDRMRLEALLRLGPYRPLFRRPPGRLLDVGCSIGDLALAFRRHGWDVAGVEPSGGAAAHAAARGVEMHCGTLDDAPWSGPSFDAIVFNHSLEHIPEPAEAVRLAARLLRPGGMLAVAVPNFGSWHRRVFRGRWFQLDLPRHLQHFDAESLSGLVENAGLQVVDRRAATMRPSLLMSLQYVAFGRPVVRGHALRLAAWAIVPLLALLDRVAEGDCLHLYAVRPA